MSRKKLMALLFGTILVATLALVAVAQTAPSPPKPTKVATVEREFGWQLSDAKVINPGQTAEIDEGTLTTDYEIEADAIAVEGGALIPRGTFRLNMTAFKPNADRPGQTAGRWYISGTWSVSASNAGPTETEARHNAATVEGDLQAELDFNPATDAGTVTATVRLPMSLLGGQWGKGEGTFSGNEKFEGTIYGMFDQWPSARRGGVRR